MFILNVVLLVHIENKVTDVSNAKLRFSDLRKHLSLFSTLGLSLRLIQDVEFFV